MKIIWKAPKQKLRVSIVKHTYENTKTHAYVQRHTHIHAHLSTQKHKNIDKKHTDRRGGINIRTHTHTCRPSLQHTHTNSSCDM